MTYASQGSKQAPKVKKNVRAKFPTSVRYLMPTFSKAVEKNVMMIFKFMIYVN